MSYTITMDMPPKASAYVKYRGPQFQAELNSLFLAFVTNEMQREGFEWPESGELSNGKAVFDAIRACPVDVDLGQLIPRRTSCGRVHPIDFAQCTRRMREVSG